MERFLVAMLLEMTKFESCILRPRDDVKPLRYRDMKEEIRRLYLKTGDQVMHRRYPQWGFGVVIEEWNSSVLGGMSYVRIIFRDGQTRVFNNNFANECCCYYAGLRRCED